MKPYHTNTTISRSRITDRHHYYEYLIKSGLKELSAHQMVDEDLDIDLDYSSIIRLVGECEDGTFINAAGSWIIEFNIYRMSRIVRE